MCGRVYQAAFVCIVMFKSMMCIVYIGYSYYRILCFYTSKCAWYVRHSSAFFSAFAWVRTVSTQRSGSYGVVGSQVVVRNQQVLQ